MEENGWTVEKKTRLNSPSHTDYYYFPPGVSRGLGFRARVDYWDSLPLLMSALKDRTDDAVSQFVVNVYNKGKDVEKLMRKNKSKSMDEFVRHLNVQLPVGIKIPENVRSLWSGSFRAFSPQIPSEHSNPPVSQSCDTGRKRKPVLTPTRTIKKRLTSKNSEKTVPVDIPIVPDDPAAAESRLLEIISRSINAAKREIAITEKAINSITDSKFANESTEAETEARLLRNIRKYIEYQSTRKTVDHKATKSLANTLNNLTVPYCFAPANDTNKSKSSISVRAKPLDHLLSLKCNRASKSIDALAAVDAPKNDFSFDPKFDSSKVTIPRKKTEKSLVFNIGNHEMTSDQRKENRATNSTLEILKIPRKIKPAPNRETSAVVSTKIHRNFSVPILPDNTKLVPSEKPLDVKAEYFRFKSKVLPVCKIEFKGLHRQIVYKFLWKQHKRLYGCICNDDCHCLSNLKKLFEGVIEKSEKSALSQGKEAPQVSRTGFVNSFAPRYYAQLSQNFPKDTPSKVLGNLLQMWKMHKKTRQFGECCSALCSCDYSILIKSVNTLLPPTQNAPATVDPTITPESPSRSLAMRTEYCINFDSSAPLGFYSTTSTKDLSSCCKVVSVNPYKADRDPRVSRGTIVRAAEVDGQRKEIESHLDLKSHYFSARSRGGKLLLWFLNQKISPYNTSSHKRNWNLSGEWSGTNEDGWAGGAEMATKAHALSHWGTTNNFEKSMSGLPSVMPDEFLQWSKQPRSAERVYPRVSAFKRPRSTISCLKVKIGEKLNKTKYYEKDNVNELSKNSAAVLGKYTDLTLAVHFGTVQDVLNVLARGADVEEKDGNNMTALQYTYESCRDHPLLSLEKGEHERMNELKRKILKFFIQGNFLLYASDALYHWSYANVSISGFRGLSPLEFSNSNVSESPTTMFYTVEVGNKRWTSPCVPISQSATWPAESVKTLGCEFHRDSYKENEVKVILYAGDHSQKTPLGKWTEDIDAIMRESDHEQANLIAKLRLTDTFFSQEAREGLMMWQLERRKFDPKEAEERRFSLTKKLFTLTAWLNKLMQEARAFNVKIDANITFPFQGNRTLLHAAVYLQDQSLVKQLLDLGADPNKRGCADGSPLEVACKKSYSIKLKSKEIQSLLMSFQSS